MTTDRTPYDRASYYTCDDEPETLSCTSPEDAIREYFESFEEFPDDFVAWASTRSVTVYSYTVVPVSYDWCERMGWRLAESFVEDFEDEFGDPNGNQDAFTEVQRTKLETALTELVRQQIDYAHIWVCEPSGQRTYTGDEVVAMCKEEQTTP